MLKGLWNLSHTAWFKTYHTYCPGGK